MIIYIGQIDMAPFAKRYISAMEEMGITYELIHWDRDGTSQYRGDHIFAFREQILRFVSLRKKLLPFLRFRAFAARHIREKKYDRLIVLTTQTAFFFPWLLLGVYRNRYFFDYRDTSYEYNWLYRTYLNGLIQCAEYVCISSPGFLKHLTPRKQYIIAHNFQFENLSRVRESCQKRREGRLVLGYIGVLRELPYLKKLADHFGGDARFQFQIHGGGDSVEELREYCAKYDNIQVHGAYQEAQKYAIIESFDLICYNYPDSFVNRPALANKFYDGLILKKPLFANSRTFSGKLVRDKGLGISIDEAAENIASQVFTYYERFDADEFSANCDRYLLAVCKEDELYNRAIRTFLSTEVSEKAVTP